MSADAAELHPLAYLLALRGQKAESYLRRVAEQHRRMGYGQMGYRREKVSRWIRGDYAPSYHTQLAMAALENIPPEATPSSSSRGHPRERYTHWRSQEVRWTAGSS